jgi:hypothetical protein
MSPGSCIGRRTRVSPISLLSRVIRCGCPTWWMPPGGMVERLQGAFHAPVRRLVPPVSFVIADAASDEPELRLTVSLTRGVLVDDAEPVATDVHVGSQAAWNTFSQPWGLSTLLISGRFRIDGPERPLLRLERLDGAAVAGYRTRDVCSLLSDRRARAMLRRTRRRGGRARSS